MNYRFSYAPMDVPAQQTSAIIVAFTRPASHAFPVRTYRRLETIVAVATHGMMGYVHIFCMLNVLFVNAPTLMK